MFPTQHGSGFRQSAKNFGKKVVSLGKKGINFILNNAGELATLGKAGYDIYQGREGGEGAMKALQKIQSRIGDKEKEAIASLIKGKKKDIKAEIKAGNVVSAKKDIVELKKLEVVQKTAKAVPPVDILSQIKAGVALKKPKPKVVPPASVPRAKEISSLMEQIQKRRQAMGLNEIKQDNQEDEAEWGSGRRVQKNLMKLVSKNMKKEKKKYKGQLMDTGLISGKNYVVGVGKPKLSSVLGGISGAAGAASMIPYLAPVAAPLSAITGAAGSIAKIFGKGHYKSSKYRSNKMLGKGLSEIASKVRGLISKYGTSSNLELARKIVMSVTGRTPTELVKQVLAKLQSKL
jgi:hypothetical protein